MPTQRPFNLVLALAVALWLPIGTCCAQVMAAGATADAAPHPPADASPACPVSDHCPSRSSPAPDAPGAPDAPAAPVSPCSNHDDACQCPAMLAAAVARAEPAAASARPDVPSAATALPADVTLPEPDAVRGRRALGPGLPDPLARSTLLELACLLTI